MDTSPFEKQLKIKQEELRAQLATLGVENPDTPGDWVTTNTGPAEADPNDVADRTESYNERRAILAQLETRYRNIERALTKITTGTYGVCEVSGEAIEPKRLHANPAARTCMQHTAAEATLPQ